MRVLGREYRHVHRWLDELFATLGPAHRSVRHHTGGVEEVRRRWGDEAARAAEIHIRKDCFGQLLTEQEARRQDPFAPVEEDGPAG